MVSRQPPRPDSGLYPDWKAWANALLRYLQMVGEESQLEAGTQLKTYVSTDVPSAEQAGQLIYQTDTLAVSASFNDIWNDFAFLSMANTWTDAQTFTGVPTVVTGTISTAALRANCADDGASAGPIVNLFRASNSPAINDELGQFLLRGQNSVGTLRDYVIISSQILSPVDGAENGQLSVGVYKAGTFTPQLRINGTGIEVASGVYSAASLQVLSTRKTGWSVDTGTDKRTANATYAGTAEALYTQATIQTLMDAVRDLSQTIKALKDDLHSTAGHGLIGT